MNCRYVQKLIPLHVEGDLRSGLANRVASHLEWCGRCNWLADEYKDSQSWLRSSQPPEFDEAFLDDLKRGVLKRVAESGASPSLFASLAQQWSRRQVLALAGTFVIVLGLVAIYFHQARVKANPDSIVELVDRKPSVEPQPSNNPSLGADAGEAPGVGSSKWHRPPNSRRGFRPRGGNSTIAETELKKPLVSQSNQMNEPANSLSEQGDAFPINTKGSREMLRIEIQTGDPSIRIIWFAPKETDLHQSKPATD